MTFRRRLLLLGLLVPGACASRSAPSSYPTNAASSARAPEGKPADVTLALRNEPPQPGDPVGAWSGLADAAGGEGGSPTETPPPGPAADPHAGHPQHGGHHHHGAH